MIDDVVCMDIESAASNDYRIKPDIDCALSELSIKIKNVEKKMTKNLNLVIDSIKINKLNLFRFQMISV